MLYVHGVAKLRNQSSLLFVLKMASLSRICRSIGLLKRHFHCKVNDDYPWDAPLRHKPKVSPPADHEMLPGISTKVFRETDYELYLGPIPATGNHAKESAYKNPEYFSYHKYSFYDIGRAIGCAYRTQPSALPKKSKPFRAPWQNEEELPGALEGSNSSNCSICSQDDYPLEKSMK
uniref:NADH-ubiquinone oxidoreductase 9 kDa subunit n=1 Tax=Anopheles atroparvus TaxID=41427 RepID=A0AAG5DPB3_ANOAO